MKNVKLFREEEFQYEKFMKRLEEAKTPDLPDDWIFAVKVNNKDEIDISNEFIDRNELRAKGYKFIGDSHDMTNDDSYIFFRRYNEFDKLFFKLVNSVKEILYLWHKDMLKKPCAIVQITDTGNLYREVTVCKVSGICDAFIAMIYSPLVIDDTDYISDVDINVSIDNAAVKFTGEFYGYKFIVERFMTIEKCENSYSALVAFYAK